MRNARIRMVGLALIAVFAMSAITVASASAALPEQSPAAGKFAGTSKESTFETKSGEKVVCKEDAIVGETTGAKTSKSTITFKGCEAFGLKCKSKGAANAGEIVLNVTGELVYISETEKKVGLINTLTAELTIECTAFQKLKVKGATLCPITPVNTKTKTYSVVCKETKGVQEPTEYFNAKKEKVKAPITETKGEGLKSFAFEQSGLSGTDTLNFETEGEIKA
jgi:hypothetical protein